MYQEKAEELDNITAGRLNEKRGRGVSGDKFSIVYRESVTENFKGRYV